CGESGRINDALEDAVRYYMKRRDLPDCDTCPDKTTTKLLSSLVTTAEMGLISSEFLEACMNLGHGSQSSNEFIENVLKVGIQHTKLLRGIGVIEGDTWKNTYDAFTEHIKLLEKMGILRSAEFFPDRNMVLATVKMLRNIPEVIILFLLASWDEADYTVDVEIIAENKISILWLSDKEFSIKKEDRNQRIFGAWKDGAQCAVCLTFDFDADTSWRNILRRNNIERDNPVVLSIGEYGPRAALPRILRLLKTNDLKAGFFIPGEVADR
ncbi:unnamed protein product, partial [marine sediment metagenome]